MNTLTESEESYRRALAAMKEVAPEAAQDLVIIAAIGVVRHQLSAIMEEWDVMMNRDGIDFDWLSEMEDESAVNTWLKERAEQGERASWESEFRQWITSLNERKAPEGGYALDSFFAIERRVIDAVCVLYEGFLPPVAGLGYVAGKTKRLPHRPLFRIPEGSFEGRKAITGDRSTRYFERGDRVSPERLALMITNRVLALTGAGVFRYDMTFTDDPVASDPPEAKNRPDAEDEGSVWL